MYEQATKVRSPSVVPLLYKRIYDRALRDIRKMNDLGRATI
jgi:hypothetical protein